jgi:hypothetical protein
LLDRLRTLLYIGACALIAGCPKPLAPLVPAPLPPIDRARALAWTMRTVPDRSMALRFKCLYQDDQRRWAVHGTIRIAPPDSLRFDYVGPLGLGSGAAVIVGDSVVWADPEENFRSLIPEVRMLWAALGVVRPPAPDAVVAGEEMPGRTVSRFAEGSDTLDYVASEGSTRTLEAELRRAGTMVARSRTDLDAHARPSQSSVLFPERSARLDLTVVAVDTTAVFTPALWRSRR